MFLMQVIFLDLNNVAVAEPPTLFDSQAYLDKGAVLWPDNWAASAASDLQCILPRITSTSGQNAHAYKDKHCVLFIAGYLLGFRQRSNS